MNLRTTFFLLILLAAGVAGWYVLDQRPAKPAESATLRFLDRDLTADNLTKIEIDRKGRLPLVLEKVGNEWTLPGKWPVRGPEVNELVRTLTTLHSRFRPTPIDLKTSLAKYGLGDDALSLKLTVGGKVVGVQLGEETSDQNRFTRATYLKLDNRDEIVRLGPGVIAALDRPLDYFQQRRLFPTARVAKDDDAGDKVEQVLTDKVTIKSPSGEVRLVKQKDGWTIEAPHKENVDPDKIRNLLAGLLDVWADRFVTSKAKTLDEMGLAKPEYTIAVQRPNGGAIAVQIGNVSEVKERKVSAPPPPFMPPGKPNVQVVKEEYRYAKLPDNAQVFEIKTDKLKDIVAPLAELRDARVARFKAADVRKLEVDWKGNSLVLAHDGDMWRLEKPTSLAAETQPVTELLDKLSELEARGADVLYDPDPKSVGLDAPIGKITVTLAEGKKEPKTTKTLVYTIGETAKDKGKLFVKLADSPRVNAVGDDVAKLAGRDALAYRQRRLLDLAAKDISKIQIARGGEGFAFARKDGVWSQIAPSPAKLDQAKVDALAGALAKLETPEFILDAKDALKHAKFSVNVALYFADAKKPSQTLSVGQQRAGKDEWFAWLDDGPTFVIKKDLHDLLERNAFAYRPEQAWQVKADDIVELRVKKGSESYTVKKEGDLWKIAGPFNAVARTDYVTAITDELALLRSDKYVAASAALAKFGLDSPYLQFEVVTRSSEKGKEKEATSILQIGKADGMSRFARLGDGDGVFLVGDKMLAIIDRGPLDLLDRVLARIDPGAITQLRVQGKAPFTLERGKDGWTVSGTPGPNFKADNDLVQAMLRPWSNLMAGKITAYGPSIDWAKFGLEKPETKIVVSAIDKEKKAIEHTLALGKDAGDGRRFARLDQQQDVAVLEPETLEDVARSYLDFIDPRVLKFSFPDVTRLERVMKNGDLELVKRDDAWQMVKPTKQAADTLTADDIVEKTFQLKAVRAAAYPAKDLAKFGLEPPVATWTIHLGDDKKHVVKVGDKAGAGDERYALIDGIQTVFVLPAALSKHLAAPLLYFADRNLASFGTADRLEFRRGERKIVFVKNGTNWDMTEPVKSAAEPGLAEFLQGLFRFRADEIVAGKDADLKAFGLEPPTAEWKVFAGDREMLDLQIGEKADSKSSRRYARLAKGAQVFLLSPKQSAAALAEYRDRKPWPALDAAQVNRVVVHGEPVNFTLVKRDNQWSEAEHPDGKVDAAAVTDLLDALASLKVDRYIADVKGNLQLYGLEKPSWRIEVATPVGSRTLLLGRAEGDSRRLYAAIAGSDAVFVIGEAEAARLTRPLGAYLQTK